MIPRARVCQVQMGFIRRLDHVVDPVTGHGAAIGKDRLALLVRFTQSSYDSAYNRAQALGKGLWSFHH